MPARHCVLVADLAEMEKAFQLPLSVYVEEFLERPSPGDRLREYAELAFANAQQIQTLRKADRQTMVMARNLQAAGQGANTELHQHLRDAAGDYARTRTTSQFKWMLHAFTASGRPWIQEAVCAAGREWVEDALNLLFTQRAFASSPEEAQEYKAARELLLKLVGPFAVKEAGRDVDDPQPAGEDAFRWLPREDGVTHLRVATADMLPLAARTLAALDLSEAGFAGADRPADPRFQGIVRTNVGRLRSFLQAPMTSPAVLSFIGA